ncbi:hypothetical protein F9H62_01780 [Vibrio alginolyticus]|nr:hypothetical protein [Vibrio alginolyticus]
MQYENTQNVNAINSAKAKLTLIQSDLDRLLDEVSDVIKDEYKTLDALKEQRKALNAQIMQPYNDYVHEDATPEQQTLFLLSYKKGHVDDAFSSKMTIDQLVATLRGYTKRVEVENAKGSMDYYSMSEGRLMSFLFAAMANAQPDLSEQFRTVKKAQAESVDRINTFSLFRNDVKVKQQAKVRSYSPYTFM